MSTIDISGGLTPIIPDGSEEGHCPSISFPITLPGQNGFNEGKILISQPHDGIQNVQKVVPINQVQLVSVAAANAVAKSDWSANLLTEPLRVEYGQAHPFPQVRIPRLKSTSKMLLVRNTDPIQVDTGSESTKQERERANLFYRGNWKENTRYYLHDMVMMTFTEDSESVDKLYRCTRGHTSVSSTDALTAPPDGELSSSWELYEHNSLFRGKWSGNTAYRVGQIVHRWFRLNVCRLNHTSSDDSEPYVGGESQTYWDELLPEAGTTATETHPIYMSYVPRESEVINLDVIKTAPEMPWKTSFGTMVFNFDTTPKKIAGNYVSGFDAVSTPPDDIWDGFTLNGESIGFIKLDVPIAGIRTRRERTLQAQGRSRLQWNFARVITPRWVPIRS